MSINRVNITGNLTRDPELRATQGGTQVLRLGVAVNDRRKNPQTGQWEDVPNFVDCVMFGTRAEAVARHLTKGAKVAIEGSLRYSSWERDGQRRSKLEVVVDELEFMSRQQGGYAAQPQPMAQPAPAPRPVQQPMAQPQQPVAQPVAQQGYAAQVPPQQPFPNADVYDEDIPF